MTRRLTVALSTLLIVLAACGASSAAPATTSRSAAPSKEPSGSSTSSAVPGTSAAPRGSEASSGSPARDHVKLSISTYAAVYGPFLIAAQKGYFAAQGLDVEIVRMAGGLATPALLSGEVPYTASAASAMGAIIKGAPLKVVFTAFDRSTQELWAAPDIKTLKDLEGKAVGVSSRGDSNELTMRLLLEQQHMDPSSVIYTSVGSSSGAMAALLSGAVPAAVVGGNTVPQLQKSGYKGHLLYNLNKVQLLYNGLATTDKELQQHNDRARRLLYATLRGREYYKTFKDATIKILAGYTKQSIANNTQDYDNTIPSMTADGTMPEDAQRADALARATILGLAPSAVPPLSQMYDYSLIKQATKQLKSSGWQPQP